MKVKRADEILVAHAETLIGRLEAMRRLNATYEECADLSPLLDLAQQLQQSMPPVQPSAAFVRSLGRELAHTAKHQVAVTRRMRRGVLIGAATVGSLVSVASLVGAVVFLISRWRARSHAQVH